MWLLQHIFFRFRSNFGKLFVEKILKKDRLKIIGDRKMRNKKRILEEKESMTLTGKRNP